ncbi:hypothetical protein NGH84_11725 [Staphylococcus saprophyticus]|uniref:hypothetical protein n=1 Tax=Staphylococcus saprophyticus TaxID=29385 RepID=UPI002DB789D2|nr:hypothetical protein [Staphylococcus saprophyticus]MEB7998931.1 hypothetical protein [Staphylococcus saprophyticus]
MAEINHRYLKDNDGDTYFPITHIDAVQGIDQSSTDNALTDMNDKIVQMNTLITEANKKIAEQKKIIDFFDTAIGDMVGDTGWVDISVPPDMKNKAQSTGFKCGIREVRAGNSLMPHNFIVRSIRLNISNITGNSMQIAQLPKGFIANNQSFTARGNGYRHPITIECLNDGTVTAFVHPDDQAKTNWLYQEFTWLE